MRASWTLITLASPAAPVGARQQPPQDTAGIWDILNLP